MKQEQNFRKQIVQGFKDTFFIWKDEILKTFKDSGILIFFLVVPLIYPVVYTFIYNNEVPRDVNCIVVDKNNSSLSREYIRKVDATPEVKILTKAGDLITAQNYLKEHKAYGVIYIPSDFSENILLHKQATVSVYSDMSVILNYKNITSATNNVALEMGNKIRIEAEKKWDLKAATISANPVSSENIFLFNSTGGFASYIMPGVLMLIIQQTLVLGIGMSSGTTREKNGSSLLVPSNSHYSGAFRVILGKALAYFMIYSLMALWVLVAIPSIFNLNQIMNAGTFFTFIIPYLCACICFSMVVSIFVKERETVMILFVFASVPLLFLSGISWPGFAIPEYWKWISYIFPSTYGVNAFAQMQNMNASLSDIVGDYQILWLQTGIYFIISCVIYQWQIRKSKRKHLNAN